MKVETFNHGFGKYTVIVEPREFITIQRDNHDPVRFVIGDQCEESSYNLIYVGTITGITEKSVMVEKRWGGKRRMKLEDFAWRNWDFDAVKVAQKNFETSQCI